MDVEATPDGRTASSERTRARLLDAALTEFAEHGYSGARVAAIAERAGVNKQLISYHFGGKRGLYDSLGESWLGAERRWRADGPSLGELVGRYLDAALADPRGGRMTAQRLLDPTFPHRTADADSADLADMRHRQQLGEIAADLDVRDVLRLFTGAVMAPVLLDAALTPVQAAAYRDLLARVATALAEPG